MVKIALAALALSGLGGLTGGAFPEETTVIRRGTGPDVSVERNDRTVERPEITIGSVDCVSTTIHKEDGLGNSKTVHKEGCN